MHSPIKIQVISQRWGRPGQISREKHVRHDLKVHHSGQTSKYYYHDSGNFPLLYDEQKS